ncbi:MAG: RHS repeat-associated core domain-containing protein, partial [bacterium]
IPPYLEIPFCQDSSEAEHSATTYFITDEQGRVLYETDNTPNLLKNPNFENGTDWAPWWIYTPQGNCTWTVVSDVVKNGFYAIMGASKPDANEGFYQTIQISECPVPMVASVYIKTQDLVNGMRLQVDFYNGSSYIGSKCGSLINGTMDWVQAVLPIYASDIPTGTTQMIVFVVKFAGTGTCWIDNFRLEGGIAPSPNEAKYVYVNNVHLCKIDAYGEPYFYLCDALGTPIRITNKNWVTVKDESFKAFGEQLTSSGTFVNTHRFTGKEYENSGIYYFGARYYDPWLGRFLTPDLLGKFEPKDPKTINPYIYCTDNPLRYVDPTGKWRTYLENGVRYAYRFSPSEAVIMNVASFMPGVSLADCGMRASTGDITLSSSDWIFASIDVVLPVVSKVIKPAAKDAVKMIDAGLKFKGAYDVANGYTKAKDYDPEIFERYAAETGLKEQPFSITSDRIKILIRNEKELELLIEISNEVANKNKKPAINLEPSDHWRYEAE